MTTGTAPALVAELDAQSMKDAMRKVRQNAITLVGQLEKNQGLPTFTGRMTLDRFADLTVVHNRKWAEDAGESMDIVTQREIIDSHANGLAVFMLQGLIHATMERGEEDGLTTKSIIELQGIQDAIGRSSHYALPPVTLVLQEEPPLRLIAEGDQTVATRLYLPAGKLFLVADGQHRREAAQRVREFLKDMIANRRPSKTAKFYPGPDKPLSGDQLDAWVAVQETFRSLSMIAYEAHIGLSVEQARQLFTNFNCYVKSVKPELNLEFDQSNPINHFAKMWLAQKVAIAGVSDTNFTVGPCLDLRQVASVNSFLFLGKTSIKNAPYNVDPMINSAQEFWEKVTVNPGWANQGNLLREIPILKGLAKAWFMVFLAKRNSKIAQASKLRQYVAQTDFNEAWLNSVPGLRELTIATPGEGFRFSPAHNEIVARMTDHILG